MPKVQDLADLVAKHRERIARRRALGYRDTVVPHLDLERLLEAAMSRSMSIEEARSAS